MNVLDFQTRKETKLKISMMTCYDYTSALIVSDSNIDCVLVGDSAAMVMHGESSTINANIEMIATHVKAVRKACEKKFIIADMSFLSYRKNLEDSVANAIILMQAGANAIKLEGRVGNEVIIKHLVDSGIPVMGHIGLTPQFVNKFGGFKVQGRNSEAYGSILEDALELEKAGCFSVVIECVPSPLAREITSKLKIPTIGIGAGLDTDGQVLVMQDMLGMNNKFKPKFLRHYLNGYELLLNAFNQYDSDVKNQTFPNIQESYE